ncbi:hypothetical protein COCMIDRAFT_21343 [Bipolaris oryzae ATCC 44560]|uniref:Uncharacterized protein n=1 Tax=Bipolaris oryzae ATCC 44560 TaxID=930090 RepID=W6ZUV6_COCMI|nr:uncharacterized protein COCMIDRAFT_21343 [Bipolaris oryzae ATCC 44560]EUC51364.1 hypothetical protein COCMIDRAFT_21343 [Bipolaris oryzae ATCC 44560]
MPYEAATGDQRPATMCTRPLQTPRSADTPSPRPSDALMPVTPPSWPASDPWSTVTISAMVCCNNCQRGHEENTISSLSAAQLTPTYMLLTPNSSEATQHFWGHAASPMHHHYL